MDVGWTTLDGHRGWQLLLTQSIVVVQVHQASWDVVVVLQRIAGQVRAEVESHFLARGILLDTEIGVDENV